MGTAYIIIVAIALSLQIAFAVLYNRWIPSWKRNAYGRLAMTDAGSRILILSVAIIISIFDPHASDNLRATLFTFAFLPLIYFGALQLVLLKRAVGSAKTDKTGEEADVS